MNRRSFLSLTPLTLVPEPRRAYSFLWDTRADAAARICRAMGLTSVVFDQNLDITPEEAANFLVDKRYPGGVGALNLSLVITTPRRMRDAFGIHEAVIHSRPWRPQQPVFKWL